MLAYRYTVLSYARGFVFVHPEEIPTGAVSDRAATVQMYRFIPPRSDFNAVAQRRAIVGRSPDITDCSVMSFQHAKGVPN